MIKSNSFEALKKRSSHRALLWVVVYVNQAEKEPKKTPEKLIADAILDTQNALEGGADGAVLINEWCTLAEFEPCVAAVRSKFPNAVLGVNYLGDESEPYGYKESFRLSKQYGLELVWTDFAGVDAIVEKPDVSLHAIEEVRDRNTFYCSGIHMKYSTLKDPAKPLERSALQAMGFVDGIIVTGPKTAMPTDPEHVRRVRAVVGDTPVGVASGTNAENILSLVEAGANFFLAASSMQKEDHRVDLEKVRRLASRL